MAIKKTLPKRFMLTNGNRPFKEHENGIEYLNAVWLLIGEEARWSGEERWYFFDLEKRDYDIKPLACSYYEDSPRISLDELGDYDLTKGPKKMLPNVFIVTHDREAKSHPEWVDNLNQIMRILKWYGPFSGTSLWYFFSFVTWDTNDASWKIPSTIFGHNVSDIPKIPLTSLCDYDLFTNPFLIWANDKPNKKPLPNKFVISASGNSLIADDKSVRSFFHIVDNVCSSWRNGLMRHYYYDMSGSSCVMSSGDEERDDHRFYSEINSGNVNDYDPESVKDIYEACLARGKKKSKWYFVRHEFKDSVSDTPMGLFLAQYLEKFSGMDIVGEHSFFVCVNNGKVSCVDIDDEPDADFELVTPEDFVLSCCPDVYLSEGWTFVVIDHVKKESMTKKNSRYVLEKNSPFFDSQIPVASLPVGDNVWILVKGWKLYGIPNLDGTNTVFSPTRSFQTESDFYNWFVKDLNLKLVSGYECVRIVPEWKWDRLDFGEFFSEVCDALEDTCNGGMPIDGSDEELFVIIKDKKPVQVLQYEPRMVYCDVPVDDFYAEYVVEEEWREDDPFNVKSVVMPVIDRIDFSVDIAWVRHEVQFKNEVSKEDSNTTSLTPTMNATQNNMLAEILKTQFFSNEANQEAIKQLADKYDELRKVLIAAHLRIDFVSERLGRDLRNLNDAISRNDVENIKKILSEYKDTVEYVDNFLDNKIGSIYEPTEDTFDVAKKFQ